MVTPSVSTTALVLVLTLGTGCSNSDDETTSEAEVRRVGNELCEEYTCSVEPDLTDCKDEMEEILEKAKANSCLDVIDAWFRCLRDSTHCTDGVPPKTSQACSDEEELAEDCRKGRL